MRVVSLPCLCICGWFLLRHPSYKEHTLYDVPKWARGHASKKKTAQAAAARVRGHMSAVHLCANHRESRAGARACPQID